MIRKPLVINGVTQNLVLNGDETLAKVLRENLLLTGCKIGCGQGHCGACNVIVDGKVIGMHGFGQSGPYKFLFPHYGFTVENVVATAKSVL